MIIDAHPASSVTADIKSSPEPKPETSTEPASSSLISTGSFQSNPVETLEMEDWELAPGRICEETTEDPENIAFSKPYLSTKTPVPVCEDVTFRVDTIHPGETWQLEPDVHKMRICSIATGKVRVKIGDAPEFILGPHGMFRVKAGVACTVNNWMYFNAVVHITSLAGFM